MVQQKTIKYLSITRTVIAILMSLVHLYTYIFGLMPTMQQRSIFLLCVLVLVLLKQIQNKLEVNKIDILSIFLTVGVIISCSYTFLNWEAISFRIVDPLKIDIILGIILLVAIIKVTGDMLGSALPMIAICFILYALIGYKLPGELSTVYFTVQRLVSHLTMETSGVYGMVLGTAGKYIFIFVIFGAFLEMSGASDYFLKLTDRLLGRTKGSGAKVDIMSSGLFGMISGSATANVMATAPMTHPMMIKNGFSPKFAGVVSAIAGTGGQLMPPIMGTAAFIIAETLAIPYSEVTIAALIPGLLYYLVIWVTVNLHSNRLGIVAKKEKQPCFDIFKSGFYYIIPLAFLILTITFLKWSPIKAGIWSIGLLIFVSQFNKENRMGIKKILLTLEKAAYNCLSVGVACATAGIIIGVLSITGLGLKFSGIIVGIAGGNMMILLFVTMIAGLIMGMGMTTTSVYIVLSVLVAPALTKFGIAPITAHLFVFYFGILSCITPPVATAVFASASIAKVNPMRLGLYTTLKAVPIYLLPFLFTLNPQLLMQGDISMIVIKAILAVISLSALCVAIEGYFKESVSIIERIILGICSICMLQSSVMVEIVANSIIFIILVLNYIKHKKVLLQSNVSNKA